MQLRVNRQDNEHRSCCIGVVVPVIGRMDIVNKRQDFRQSFTFVNKFMTKLIRETIISNVHEKLTVFMRKGLRWSDTS